MSNNINIFDDLDNLNFEMPSPIIQPTTTISANHFADISSDFAVTPPSRPRPPPSQLKRGASKQMSSIDDDDDDELEAKAIADKNYGKGLKRASTRYRKLKNSLGDLADFKYSETEKSSPDEVPVKLVRKAVAARAPPRQTFVIDDSDDDYNKANVAGCSSGSVGASAAAAAAAATAAHDLNDENHEIQVKVKWNGTIERIPLRKYQKLQDLFKSLANRHANGRGDGAANIILMMNDQLLDPNDTLASIGYTIGKFIIARIADNLTGILPSKTRGADQIELKIQSSLWKRPMMITVGKGDALRLLMIKCAEELKCDASKIKLRFDGETLDLNATPDDLDMVDGEVLDLQLIK